MHVITSPSNPRIIEAAALHRSRARRDTGTTLLEGPAAVGEAIAAGAALDVVFAADPTDPIVGRARTEGIEVVEVSTRVLDRLAGTSTPRGPVAVLRIPPARPATARDAVVLSGLADPGNVGTLVRTAAAFDFAVEIEGETADPWAPKVLRSAAGGHFRTPVSRRPAPLGALRDADCALVALVPHGGEGPEVLNRTDPVALLVGSEAHGLRPEIVAEVDLLLTLPMPGVAESLNAAVAGAIAMYERCRYRT